jgi:hypothetical protein
MTNIRFRWIQLHNTKFPVINKKHTATKQPDVAKMSTERIYYAFNATYCWFIGIYTHVTLYILIA